MDAQIRKLIQIKNYIQQASVCNENGFARLRYMMAIDILQEVSTELNDSVLTLEHVGEQPKEILRL
jgi:hypothetical protein